MDEFVSGVLWMAKQHRTSIYMSDDLIIIYRDSLIGIVNEYEGNLYKGSDLILFIDGYRTPTLDEFLNVSEPSEEIKQEILFSCKFISIIEHGYDLFVKIFKWGPDFINIIGSSISISKYPNILMSESAMKYLTKDNKKYLMYDVFIISFESSCFYGERLSELVDPTDEQIMDALTPCSAKSAKK